MNIFLWILQTLLGFLFIYNSAIHFNLPPDLPPNMAWMYDLPIGLHYFSGTAEILAGLGLILPGLTRIQTRLTPLAALGLVIVMFGAATWHLQRAEFAQIVGNLILAGIAGFVAYGRWKLRPLKDRA
ncbi:MAG: DoxX family protein [Anaerolineales bacterium]|nr:DoxX family protein [Anaerolineales bacterium]